jgi:hypothetical protein
MKKLHSGKHSTLYIDTYGTANAAVDRSPDGGRWLPTLNGQPLGQGTYRSRDKAEQLAYEALEALEKGQTAEANARAILDIKKILATTLILEDLAQREGIKLTDSEKARVKLAKELRTILITNGAG